MTAASRRHLRQLRLHPAAEFAGVPGQLVALNDFEDFQRHSAGERGAAVSCAMRTGVEQIGERRPHPEGPHRHTARRGFGHRRWPSGKNVAAPGSEGIFLQNALKTLKPPRAEVAALHPIHKEQQLVLIAKLAQSQQIVRAGREGRRSPPASPSIEDGRGGGRQRGARGGKIIESNMAEAGTAGPKPFLTLAWPGGGDARQCPAMKRLSAVKSRSGLPRGRNAGRVCKGPRWLRRRCCRKRPCPAPSRRVSCCARRAWGSCSIDWKHGNQLGGIARPAPA